MFIFYYRLLRLFNHCYIKLFIQQNSFGKKIMQRKTTLKTLMFAAVAVSFFTQVAAQWSTIKSVGTGPNDGCFSFNLNGKGYVGGGTASGKFYLYDTVANTWTLKGNAPGNKNRGFGISFVVNGKAYVAGGDTTGGANVPTADMWMYNDTTNTWTQKASFAGGGRDALFCFVINNTAYAGGGFAGSTGMSDFYKYNPVTDAWTALSPLSMGVVGFPVTFVINNKAYLTTGQVGSTESTGLWQYDPATDTWITKASLPGAARQTAFGFAIDDYGYVGGGMANYDTTFTDMWRYDPVANSWSAASGIPSIHDAWATAFTVGNTAFVGSGSFLNTLSLDASDSFHKFWGIPNPALSATGVQPVRHVQMIPNPAYDYINIVGDLEPGTIVSVSDLTGRAIKTFPDPQTRLYIGDLQPGLYFVRCISPSGILTEKMIKE
jgi:N-acetylneuraminic acid mutarotase